MVEELVNLAMAPDDYRIALIFGGAKLWRISLHKKFGVLNFGETSTKRIIVQYFGEFWTVIFGDSKAIRQIRQNLAPPKFSAIRY